MPRLSRQSTYLGLGVLALTGLNVGYSAIRDRLNRPLPPWEFPVGAQFPSATLRPLAAALPAERAKVIPSACRLVVIFDVNCPHCHTAKIVEAAIPDSIRLPVIWVSTVDDVPTARFATGLSATSALRFAAKDSLAALTVRATPIAFLVTATGRVGTIVPYAGTESQHRAVRRACATVSAASAESKSAAGAT